MSEVVKVAKRGKVKVDGRGDFWSYCQRAAGAARARAIAKNVPFEIDAHVIDRLLVDQKWRCAVSGLILHAPTARMAKGYAVDPFAPSLDRIVPAVGYIPGNLRVVCNIVNAALNDWGIDNLMILIRALREPMALPASAPDAGCS